MNNQTNMYKSILITSVVVFCLFGLISTGFSEKVHDQEIIKKSGEQRAAANALPPNHHIIYGTVEGVNANTIKVNAGAIGEISPRYLELEKIGEKAKSLKQGDRLQITVNNKNKVIDYHLENGNH